MEHGERQLAGGSRQPVSHLPSASLGQCAALSFIVKGRDRRSEVRGQRSASQMVNSSNSQMVMNGVNDELTI